MNLAAPLSEAISQAFKQLFDYDLAADEIKWQPTRKEFPGSHTFVTFPYARISKKSPEETGQMLGAYLKEHSDLVADFNVVKGFLNLSLSDAVWLEILNQIVRTKDYGQQPSNGQMVTVEFASPNTNKPLHLGHLRNIFLGFSVNRIMKAAGYEVKKVNIVNDRGIHICKSMLAYQKFGNGETPESSGTKGDHLVGHYYVKFDQAYKQEIQELVGKGISEEEAGKRAPLMLEAQEMLQKWEENDPEVVALWKKMNQWVYQGFDQTYETMGVSFDKIYYESNTYLLGKDLVEKGLKEKVFYQKPDGSVWVDLTDQGQDQKLLLRSDGTSVYMTQDLGTAELRYQDFLFTRSVYVVGNEQDYHFDVLFKILKKMGRGYADGMYHLSYGMVDLPTGKMKSREGTVVDADQLMEEMVNQAREKTEELGKIEDFNNEQLDELYQTLGLGALKYYLMKVDPKKRMLFNPEESVALHGDTGVSIQYTHARISQILRTAQEQKVPTGNVEIKDFEKLEDLEKELIQLLHQFPEKIKVAAEELAPSVIAQYTYELAKTYNRFFAELSIFKAGDPKLMQLRVLLSQQTGRVISKALSLLGIDAPERM
ncbi:MAG: arginine--tRNA ligase [Cyclobacteriaceae bacterium]